MNTNNGKRLVAAVAILAMLACCLAVAIPSSDAAEVGEGTYAEGITEGYTNIGDVASISFVKSDGSEWDWDAVDPSITNTNLGNKSLSITVDDNTVYVTGTLGYQDANSQLKVSGAPNGFNYGFVFDLAAINGANFGTDKAVYIFYENSMGDWKQLTKNNDTSTQLVYVNSERESTTYYISDSVLEKDGAETAVSNGTAKKVVVEWNFTLGSASVTADQLSTIISSGAKDIQVTSGEINTEITLTAGQTVSIGTEVSIGTSAKFTVPEGATVGYSIPTTSAVESFIVVGGDGEDAATATFKNMSGNFTITGGSIDINGNVTGGEIVFSDNKSVAKITGTITGNFTVTGVLGDKVIFVNTNIANTATVTLDGAVTYEVQNLRLYGQIQADADGKTTHVTLDVNTYTEDGKTVKSNFTAYAGATFGKYVYLNGTGNIDVSSAMEDFEVNNNVVGDYTYPQFQRVIITNTLTIKSGVTMTVLGELVINNGVTLIIEPGAVLQVGDSNIIAVGVTVDGTIEIYESATVNGNNISAGKMDVQSASNVTVNGTITSSGELNVSSNLTIKSGGIVNIDDSVGSKITTNSDNNFIVEAGGNLQISGQMSVGEIYNKGTITLYEAVLVGNSTIHMAADGAVVNVDVLTSTGKYYLLVNDLGLNAGKDENKADVIIDENSSNAIKLVGNTDAGIEGLTITESVTSKTVNKKIIYTNILNLSGAMEIVDDRDNTNSSSTLAYQVDMDGVNISVAAEDTLTIGEGVTVNLYNFDFNINGTVDAVDATISVKGTPEVNVQGILTTSTSNSNVVETVVNAFHYSVKRTGTTDGYEVYTTLVNALANSDDIEYFGEVEILSSADIPTGTVIEAVNNAAMKIGDTDNRDVIVTFAAGSSLRNGGQLVTVDGTLVFEDYTKDCRNTSPVSDVQIDDGDKKTYTNIYTALETESGTVTLSRPTVDLDKDIEIKSGVTLVIPANTTVYLYDGVTMTVNGAVENSGDIANKKDATDTAATNGAGFNPVKNGEANTDAAVIAVNGAFKSLDFTDFTDYYIPGAYYQIVDTEGSWYWITPVEDAAAVAADTENGITINGKVTVGDVDFAGTSDETVVITIATGADVTAGSISLSYATLDVNGWYNGTVDTAVGAVDVVNATGFTVSDLYDADNNELMTLSETPVLANSDVKNKSIEVSSGTLTVNAALDVKGITFTVASGASVNVIAGGELTANAMIVNGTLTAVDAGKVNVGTLTVNGTFNVAAADNDNGIKAGTASITDLLVGISIDEKTGGYVNPTAASVTADAITGLGRIVVSSESTVTGKLVENVDNTEFYVEDTLWITVYILNAYTGDDDYIATYESADKTVYGYVPTGLTESEFVGWNDADGKLITVSTDGTKISIGSTNYTKVYANINYNVYKVAITLDNTVGSVAIDGQMLTYDINTGSYVLPNNQMLTAGQHTVTYTLNANYEGTPTMASNGANVTVSGLTFTLSGDFEDANGNTIVNYLSLGGATLADQTIVIEGGNNGGDDGMGLTDYLLIILVILIVIMAIMVAFRLMRS